MIGVSVVIIVQGTVNVGGPANVLNVTYERGRLNFFEYEHIFGNSPGDFARPRVLGFRSADHAAAIDDANVGISRCVFSRASSLSFSIH